eukprot:GHVR01166653.1.p1 GENE.GHVR01166653.1~~GHVR01166653.1.p1  ORF type:complete len:301 (+),score=99.84 GHVR01166653.1:36-938(+)
MNVNTQQTGYAPSTTNQNAPQIQQQSSYPLLYPQPYAQYNKTYPPTQQQYHQYQQQLYPSVLPPQALQQPMPSYNPMTLSNYENKTNISLDMGGYRPLVPQQQLLWNYYPTTAVVANTNAVVANTVVANTNTVVANTTAPIGGQYTTALPNNNNILNNNNNNNNIQNNNIQNNIKGHATARQPRASQNIFQTNEVVSKSFGPTDDTVQTERQKNNQKTSIIPRQPGDNNVGRPDRQMNRNVPTVGPHEVGPQWFRCYYPPPPPTHTHTHTPNYSFFLLIFFLTIFLLIFFLIIFILLIYI